MIKINKEKVANKKWSVKYELRADCFLLECFSAGKVFQGCVCVHNAWPAESEIFYQRSLLLNLKVIGNRHQFVLERQNKISLQNKPLQLLEINGVLFPWFAVSCTIYISACLLRRDEGLHAQREHIALLKLAHHCLAQQSYDIMVCQEQSLNLWSFKSLSRF